MFGFVSFRRHRAELAAADAEADRQRELAEKALAAQATAEFNRRQVLRTNAGLDEQLTDTRIVNGCLTEDLTAAREQLADALEQAAVEKRRADRLQARLDDLLGLDDPAVTAGASWQDRREQKMRWDK